MYDLEFILDTNLLYFPYGNFLFRHILDKRILMKSFFEQYINYVDIIDLNKLWSVANFYEINNNQFYFKNVTKTICIPSTSVKNEINSLDYSILIKSLIIFFSFRIWPKNNRRTNCWTKCCSPSSNFYLIFNRNFL